MKKAFLHKCSAYVISGVVLSIVLSSAAFAAPAEVDDVMMNISSSSAGLPGIIRAGCYLFGMLLGVSAILKMKEHVESPTQVPLRTPVIRALIGGSLFSLPIVTQAVLNAYNGGTSTVFQGVGGTAGGAPAFGLGMLYVPGPTGGIFVNDILQSIRQSFEDTPVIITGGSYLLGLVLTVSGLLKIKEHVERPEQTEIRESVTRLLTAGALFALPTIYDAVHEAFGGNPNNVASAANGSILLRSFYDMGSVVCNPLGTSLGNSICHMTQFAGGIPLFLTFTAYLLGLGLAVWGILKIKAHVLNPQQVGLNEGVMRLAAAGAFFALPTMVNVMKAVFTSPALNALIAAPVSGFAAPSTTGCTGLDGIVYCLMNDTFGPVGVAINFFAFSIGTILIMVGISRLIKSSQDGARGPAGLGTAMTFLAGGALIGYNELMRAVTATFFVSPVSNTNGLLEYTNGMTGAEVQHAQVVIGSIIKFMILVGLISFLRGIYIIREVADGNQQASMMAGLTHIIGGALAVNLGPLINAVENTLGIVGFGINFT